VLFPEVVDDSTSNGRSCNSLSLTFQAIFFDVLISWQRLAQTLVPVGPSICAAMEPWMMSVLEAEGGVPRIQPWMRLALGCERGANVQQQRAIDRIKEQHGGELPSDLYNQMLSAKVLLVFFVDVLLQREVELKPVLTELCFQISMISFIC
jgi:hypothetical protein